MDIGAILGSRNANVRQTASSKGQSSNRFMMELTGAKAGAEKTDGSEKTKPGKTEMYERAVQMAAPIKLNKNAMDLEGDITLAILGLTGGTSMFTGMKLMGLLGKYDPEKMTMEEYDKFRGEINEIIGQEK